MNLKLLRGDDPAENLADRVFVMTMMGIGGFIAVVVLFVLL